VRRRTVRIDRIGGRGIHTRAVAPTPAHDQLVKRAISDFVAAVEGAAEWQSCSTDSRRKALIARDDVKSSQGNAYWLYLGDWN